jgi:hypothetical protein
VVRIWSSDWTFLPCRRQGRDGEHIPPVRFDFREWLFPDAFEDYLAPIPPEERSDMIAAYHRRLTSLSEAVAGPTTNAINDQSDSKR